MIPDSLDIIMYIGYSAERAFADWTNNQRKKQRKKCQILDEVAKQSKASSFFDIKSLCVKRKRLQQIPLEDFLST